MRLLVEVAQAVRGVLQDDLPLAVRVSSTDWTEGGWTGDDTVHLARRLKTVGVDLIDCSSGGNVAQADVPVNPGYQAAFAQAVRREAEVASAAVGLITQPQQAQRLIEEGAADIVLLGRELLRIPNWPLLAAQELGQRAALDALVPPQYARAF